MESIGQQHGEKDPEQGRGEHAALFDSTADREWLRCCSIVAHRALHALLKGLEDSKASWGTFNLLQDLEEPAPDNRVKRLRQIYEGEV